MSAYDDATVEQVLGGSRTDDPTCVLVEQLRELANAAAPTPSALLAQLLADGCAFVADPMAPVDPAPATRRTRRVDRTGALLAALPTAEVARRDQVGRRVAAAVLVGSVTLGLTGAAAAHDVLPGPAETVVRSVVNTITTFHIDVPPRRHETSHPAPVGVRPPAGDRFDGASALSRVRAPSVTSGSRPTGTAWPTGGQPVGSTSSRSVAASRKQRAPRAGAPHVRRVAARVALPPPAKHRVKHRPHHHPQPGTQQLPPTLLTFGLAARLVAASRSNHAAHGGPSRDIPRLRRAEQLRDPRAGKVRGAGKVHGAHALRRRHRPHPLARVVTSQDRGLRSDT